MKNKFLLLLLFSSKLVLSQFFGYNDNVEKKVLTRFDLLFPSAGSKQWAAHRDDVSIRTVTFTFGGYFYNAEFDTSGNLLRKGVIISLEYTPVKISNYLKTHYSSYMNKITLITRDSIKGTLEYKVKIDSDTDIVTDGGVRIYFNDSGTYLRKVFPGGFMDCRGTINNRILNKFDSLFPYAVSSSWMINSDHDLIKYVSFQCNCDENYSIAELDTFGNLIEKGRLLSLSESPRKMIDYINKHYPNYNGSGLVNEGIDQYNKIQYSVKTRGWGCADCPTTFVFFDGDGNFVKEDKWDGYK